MPDIIIQHTEHCVWCCLCAMMAVILNIHTYLSTYKSQRALKQLIIVIKTRSGIRVMQISCCVLFNLKTFRTAKTLDLSVQCVHTYT